MLTGLRAALRLGRFRGLALSSARLPHPPPFLRSAPPHTGTARHRAVRQGPESQAINAEPRSPGAPLSSPRPGGGDIRYPRRCGQRGGLSGDSQTPPVRKEGGSRSPGTSVVKEKQETPCRRVSHRHRGQRRLPSRRAAGRCPAISCEAWSDFPNPSELHLSIVDSNRHLTGLLGG